MEMKIWDKGEDINKAFEDFTVGKDRELDLFLAKYDVQASIVHAHMLAKVGLIDDEEAQKLENSLNKISELIRDGAFTISPEVEDMHSEIESMLINDLGDLGKKIHTGRSRNDQVLVALKLFTRENLTLIAEKVLFLFDLLLTKSNDYQKVLMPGYTHMQVAMPSSFGLWFGAFAESLVDDLIMIKAAHEVANKNPLGSAAGYGSSFPLDREFTTKHLGFSSPNVNSVYAQTTRGKLEKMTAFALSSLAGTLNKLASDVVLYSGENFGFFQIPVEFTTGSSIMPHKHNPDGFEILRGKTNQLQALPMTLTLLLNNLQTGYHRDTQLLKEQFIPAVFSIQQCLDMTISMLRDMEVSDDLLADAKYDLVFSVELVNELVLGGMTFRDAYKEVAKRIKDGSYEAPRDLNHSHLGSIGNLGNNYIKKSFMDVFSYFEE